MYDTCTIDSCGSVLLNTTRELALWRARIIESKPESTAVLFLIIFVSWSYGIMSTAPYPRSLIWRTLPYMIVVKRICKTSWSPSSRVPDVSGGVGGENSL